MSSSYTRRTHIVRVPLDIPPADDPTQQPILFADVEIMDAISFRTANNQEVILSIAAANSAPYIIDDTGGDHGMSPGNPTQRTIMQRITSQSDPTAQLDIETMNAAAFTDQNGGSWVLDMNTQNSAIYDTRDGSITGDGALTRHGHSELISDPFTKAGDPTPTDPSTYVTSLRNDDIAFRKANNYEVIIACPSNDDPTNSDMRASTFVWSPQDPYDPSDDSDTAVVPPLLIASGDPHNYVCAVKDAPSFVTGDAKINMGPLWWIRKISNGGMVEFYNGAS